MRTNVNLNNYFLLARSKFKQKNLYQNRNLYLYIAKINLKKCKYSSIKLKCIYLNYNLKLESLTINDG